MKYYISDLHIGCINNHDNRTFEHDKLLINNWNTVVNNNDDIYILGDIGRLGNNKENSYVASIISQLKGKKHLIIGNHDKKGLKDNRINQLFVNIKDYDVIGDNNNGINYNIVLSHYPILFWENQHKGYIHLYGHVHNSEEDNIYKKCLEEVNLFFKKEETKGRTDCPRAFAYNVGAMLDNFNYTPKSIKQIVDNYN